MEVGHIIREREKPCVFPNELHEILSATSFHLGARIKAINHIEDPKRINIIRNILSALQVWGKIAKQRSLLCHSLAMFLHRSNHFEICS